MDELTRHPDDATLFDLVEGALEVDRDQQVRAHLARCSACAAFVEDSRATAPETTSAVVELPAADSERLHLRLRDGWRERTARIGAVEASADARRSVPARPLVTAPDDLLVPPRRAEDSAGSGRRPWSRRLVPVLAFGVLALLAGTSIWIGGDAPAPQRGADAGADQETAGSTSGEPSSGDLASVPDIAAETSTAPAPGTQQPAAGASGPDDQASAEAEVDPTVDGRTVPIDRTAPRGEVLTQAPVGADRYVDGTICVISFDAASLELPEERIPQQVLPGPFGMYLVCG